MNLNAEKIYREQIAAGDDWADKNAAADLFEETKKTVLAQMMTNSGAKTSAAAETLALCTPEYREHISAMVEARRLANRAKVKYDSLKTLAELRRSQESTRRAEINLT